MKIIGAEGPVLKVYIGYEEVLPFKVEEKICLEFEEKTYSLTPLEAYTLSEIILALSKKTKYFQDLNA